MRVAKTDAYQAWIDSLKDTFGRARVIMRVDRLIHGNPGVFCNLTEGVAELKIDVGPGYRVYYSIRATPAASCWGQQVNSAERHRQCP